MYHVFLQLPPGKSTISMAISSSKSAKGGRFDLRRGGWAGRWWPHRPWNALGFLLRFLAGKWHGSLNVPMFHITQPLGIWSIMATIRWCPIFPKWDIYQPLENDGRFADEFTIFFVWEPWKPCGILRCVPKRNNGLPAIFPENAIPKIGGWYASETLGSQIPVTIHHTIIFQPFSQGYSEFIHHSFQNITLW